MPAVIEVILDGALNVNELPLGQRRHPGEGCNPEAQQNSANHAKGDVSGPPTPAQKTEKRQQDRRKQKCRWIVAHEDAGICDRTYSEETYISLSRISSKSVETERIKGKDHELGERMPDEEIDVEVGRVDVRRGS